MTHLDLKDNDFRVAGLMALQLGHRMNQTLISMETPKSYKVDQVSPTVEQLNICLFVCLFVHLFVCSSGRERLRLSTLIRVRVLVCNNNNKLCRPDSLKSGIHRSLYLKLMVVTVNFFFCIYLYFFTNFALLISLGRETDPSLRICFKTLKSSQLATNG